MLPGHLRPLFWDVEIQSFEPQSHPDYTILRILEYGNEAAVAWLRRSFPESAIVAAIRNGRRLSRKSATFWALVYSVPHGEVAALRQSLR